MYSPPFPSYKDDHITKHAEQLIKILKDQKIPLDNVIEVLEEQLATEAEERWKALEKEKKKYFALTAMTNKSWIANSGASSNFTYEHSVLHNFI